MSAKPKPAPKFTYPAERKTAAPAAPATPPPPRKPRARKKRVYGGAPSSEVMTPKHLARLAAVHISTVLRWILHGKIPARKIAGSRYLIRRQDAEDFLNGVEVQPVPRIDWKRGGDDGPTAA